MPNDSKQRRSGQRCSDEITTDAAATGRVPPHSQEAEEQLLSACLLDGGDVVSRCLEGKITAASFYVPANRLIYEKLLELYNAGQPIDIAILAEELKTTRQLDEIGGYSYLTRISGRIPTTAGAAYFIEKVRELALLREIIRAATGAVEDCYGYTGKEDLPAIVARLETTIGRACDGTATPLAERLKARAFDPARQIEAPEVRYTIQGKPVCTPANIANLIGQAKGGKSTVVGAFIAAPIAEEAGTAEDCDLLGVRASNPAGRVLLHIDTEQSPYDAQMAIKRALRRARVSHAPDWLRSYALAGFGAVEMREALCLLVADAKRAGGIFAIILDGVADLCADVNDAEEANALVAELHALAIEHAAPIINVIHENPGQDSGKARGHLGSQLERKAESNLRIRKNDQASVIFSEKQRGAPILEKDGPCFEWSDMAGMHVSVASKGDSQGAAKVAQLRDTAEEVFEGGKLLTYTELRDAIEKARGCARRTAERAVDGMRNAGLIVSAGAGKLTFKS